MPDTSLTGVLSMLTSLSTVWKIRCHSVRVATLLQLSLVMSAFDRGFEIALLSFLLHRHSVLWCSDREATHIRPLVGFVRLIRPPTEPIHLILRNVAVSLSEVRRIILLNNGCCVSISCLFRRFEFHFRFVFLFGVFARVISVSYFYFLVRTFRLSCEAKTILELYAIYQFILSGL